MHDNGEGINVFAVNTSTSLMSVESRVPDCEKWISVQKEGRSGADIVHLKLYQEAPTPRE